jgi:hypothetical protein
MMSEALGRAIQADRERAIREALRNRAMIEGRQSPPEPSAAVRHLPAVERPVAAPQPGPAASR